MRLRRVESRNVIELNTERVQNTSTDGIQVVLQLFLLKVTPPRMWEPEAPKGGESFVAYLFA